MCVCLNESDLGTTHILVHSVDHPETGERVHVTLYQNQPDNLSDDPFGVMILPIPSSAPMSSKNFIDCRGAERTLEEYARYVPSSMPATRGLSFLGGGDFEVFETGSYTVILAKDPSYETVREALQALPEDRRPDVEKSAEIFEFYAKVYRGCHLAVCIWKGTLEAEPIGYWYRPKDPTKFFVPGLDAHTGHVPENTDVDVNHVLIVGQPEGARSGNAERAWRRAPEHLQVWLPKQVTGLKIENDVLDNGDWILPLSPKQDDFETRVWPKG